MSNKEIVKTGEVVLLSDLFNAKSAKYGSKCGAKIGINFYLSKKKRNFAVQTNKIWKLTVKK